MVTLQGKVIGYSVETYPRKDGATGENHTLRVADQWGNVESVRVPMRLRDSLVDLRESDAFGREIAAVCRLVTVFENYERTAALELTDHPVPGRK